MASGGPILSCTDTDASAAPGLLLLNKKAPGHNGGRLIDACWLQQVKATPLHSLTGGLDALALLGCGLLLSDDAGRSEIHASSSLGDDALFLDALVETLQELLETFTFL